MNSVATRVLLHSSSCIYTEGTKWHEATDQGSKRLCFCCGLFHFHETLAFQFEEQTIEISEVKVCCFSVCYSVDCSVLLHCTVFVTFSILNPLPHLIYKGFHPPDPKRNPPASLQYIAPPHGDVCLQCSPLWPPHRPLQPLEVPRASYDMWGAGCVLSPRGFPIGAADHSAGNQLSLVKNCESV